MGKYNKLCVICKTPFWNSQPQALCCSEECRLTYRLRRDREYKATRFVPKKTSPPKPYKTPHVKKSADLEIVRAGLRKIVAGNIDCLRCGRTFKSKDIRNIRICLKCHASEPDIADITGYEVNTRGAHGNRRS